MIRQSGCANCTIYKKNNIINMMASLPLLSGRGLVNIGCANCTIYKKNNIINMMASLPLLSGRGLVNIGSNKQTAQCLCSLSFLLFFCFSIVNFCSPNTDTYDL